MNPMVTPTTIPERTEEGERLAVLSAASFLDDHFPEWAEKVNLKQLDLYSDTSCVLGQVFGDYAVGRNLLLNHGWQRIQRSPFIPMYMNSTHKTWVEEIRRRQVGI